MRIHETLRRHGETGYVEVAGECLVAMRCLAPVPILSKEAKNF